jgi:argininosuccinate lyase
MGNKPMKLWQKDYSLDQQIQKFTVGGDHLLDQHLIEYDCQASLAHAEMLQSIGVLSLGELADLKQGLAEISELAGNKDFPIDEACEDCHTAIENYLTDKFGEAGKKIHAARSRNDQVLTCLRLYEKYELGQIDNLLIDYQSCLAKLVARQGTIPLPGYTHMQRAMPTTIAMWLLSFKDSADDNRLLLRSVLALVDQSPLGTAAGFGVPVLKIDREQTARALGFKKVMKNPMYAALSRGKFETQVINLCSQIMFDLNKLASDLILFNTTEFGFTTLPSEICTGSSIMPQKSNPDVLELLRGQYHIVLGEEFKVKSLLANLISGYNRDLQLTKEPLIKSVNTTKACLEIIQVVLNKISFNKAACKKALSPGVFATEKALELVQMGLPFREAYRAAAKKMGEIK